MLKLLTVIAFLLFAGFVFQARAASVKKARSWVVVYTDKVDVFRLMDYDLVVLDSDYHPDLRPLQEGNRTVLGYISLGEVEQHRDWFDDVKAQGLLMDENPNWPGSFYVDVRSPLWIKRVVEELVPRILHKGFDGIFIDTMDNPVYLEEEQPEKYKGMTEAAANMIKAIARHYPDMPIMLNRAYKIIPETGKHLAYVLGESVYAGYDFEAKKPHLQTDDEYRYQVDLLQAAQKQHPHLQVMTLDYWDTKETDKIKDIYSKQRENGFVPYVSTVELNQIFAEPVQ